MASTHIGVERELLKHPAFRNLNGTAKAVLFDFMMRRKVDKKKSHRNGSGMVDSTSTREEKIMEKQKTVQVKIWGGSYPAYRDDNGLIRVYDPVAGHYTTCHSLTEGQIRYVRSRTRGRKLPV